MNRFNEVFDGGNMTYNYCGNPIGFFDGCDAYCYDVRSVVGTAGNPARNGKKEESDSINSEVIYVKRNGQVS